MQTSKQELTDKLIQSVKDILGNDYMVNIGSSIEHIIEQTLPEESPSDIGEKVEINNIGREPGPIKEDEVRY